MPFSESTIKVGPTPGVTRVVGTAIRIHPLLMVWDSPGILSPFVTSVDDAMKLALCHASKDSVIGTALVIDYFLYWCNKTGHMEYVDFYDLEAPVDDVNEFLIKLARRKNFFRQASHLAAVSSGIDQFPDLDRAMNLVLNDFRRGNLGKFMLDEDLFDSG